MNIFKMQINIIQFGLYLESTKGQDKRVTVQGSVILGALRVPQS